MSEIYIQSEGLGLDRVVAMLAGIASGRDMQKAMNAALKRASAAGRAEAGRYVAERYYISASTFKKYFESEDEMKGEGSSDQSLSVTFRGGVIPLIEFNTHYTKNGGVSVKVKKGGGGTLRHAFISNMNGSYQVYERYGRGKGKLKRLYGPSAAHMLEDQTVNDKMQKRMDEVFNQRMEHEMNRIMNGW